MGAGAVLGPRPGVAAPRLDGAPCSVLPDRSFFRSEHRRQAAAAFVRGQALAVGPPKVQVTSRHCQAVGKT